MQQPRDSGLAWSRHCGEGVYVCALQGSRGGSRPRICPVVVAMVSEWAHTIRRRRPSCASRENLWLHLRWYRNWSVLNTLSDTLKTFLTAYISHFIRIKTKQCQGYSGEHHTVTLPQHLQVNARGLSYSSSISHSPQLHGLLSASALHSIISESGLINSHFPRWKIKWLWKEFQCNDSVKQCKAKDTHQQFSSQSAVIFQSCQMQAQSCWNHSNLDQEGP